MSVKMPTVGRFISYFPPNHMKYSDLWGTSENNPYVPALVTQAQNGPLMEINVQIFCNSSVNESQGVILFGKDIPHKSRAGGEEGYWDWPEIK